MLETPGCAIRYRVAIEDMVAFNKFYCRNSTAVRAMQRRYALIMLPLVFLVFLAVFALIRPRGVGVAVVEASCGTAALALYFRYYYKRGYLRRMETTVRKLYAEGENPSLLGSRVLEADEHGLTVRTEVSETRHAWGGLVRIESEPGYTYLFTGATTACVVPHSSITDGDLPALLEKIQRHYRPDAKLGDRARDEALPS